MAFMRPLNIDEISDVDIRKKFQHYHDTRGFHAQFNSDNGTATNIVNHFMALNQAILYEGTVSEELKMLVSLISSFATGCLYCQSHMANLSHLYNAPDEKISEIMNYETSDQFTMRSAPLWIWLIRPARYSPIIGQ